jgi:long-chain acyl-CoA synthetase
VLARLLRRAVERDPGKIALVQGELRLSYGAMDAEVARCAAGLAALGVGRGDCVGAVLPNGSAFVVSLLAVARLGAVLAPLNPLYRREELERFLRDCSARLIIADTHRAAACRAIAAELTPSAALVVVGGEAPDVAFEALGGDLPSAAEAAYVGPAVHLYTSGSTDTYKRISCTQENLHFEALNFVETLGLGAEDTILCTVPLYHSYGLGNGLMDALYLGATLVLPPPYGEAAEPPFGARAGELIQLIESERVRVYPGVPHQFAVLAAWPAAAPADLSGLRFCVSSGDVLPRRTFEAFSARFGQPIRSLYGSTEAGSIAIDARPADEVVFGSLGRPLKNVEIEVRDGQGVPLAQDVAGAIWVKSPVIPPNLYANRPELSASLFKAGFYDTGDVGLIDPDGRLVMTGRKQNFVDIAGYKVDLGEVEEALQSCPGVSDAVALGVDAPRIGMLIKAVVVARPDCTDAAIRNHCRDRLAFFKTPRLIERRESLPRSPIGKVLKSELADVSDYVAALVRGGGDLARQAAAAPPVRRRALLERLVHIQLAGVLGRPQAEIPRNSGFADLGLDSFTAIELRARLEYLIGQSVPETLTFDYPTVAAIADYLADLPPAEPAPAPALAKS